MFNVTFRKGLMLLCAGLLTLTGCGLLNSDLPPTNTTGWIYWTDATSGKIQRVPLNGVGVEDVVLGLNQPLGLDIDAREGRLYWVDGIDAGVGAIQTALLNGAMPTTLYAGVISPFSLVVDPARGHLYWSSKRRGDGRIQRASLAGPLIEDVATGLSDPGYLALDVGGGWLYWVEEGEGRILRTHVESGETERLIAGLKGPAGLALDPDAGHLYWWDHVTERIWRADLDGANANVLFAGPEFRSFEPGPLVFDEAGRYLYWPKVNTFEDQGMIRRVHVDGGEPEDVVTNAIASPFGLALVQP